jgi:hypothetical protein
MSRATKNNIHEHLGLTFKEYDTQYFERYSNWCESVVLTLLEYQKVLANSQISKWYNREFEKCEQEFLTIINDYPNATTESKKQCYDRCAVRLFSIFPKVLIDEAKKRQPVKERAMTMVGCLKIEPDFLTLN